MKAIALTLTNNDQLIHDRSVRDIHGEVYGHERLSLKRQQNSFGVILLGIDLYDLSQTLTVHCDRQTGT